MLKRINKYIIIIITFYIFYLGVLPLVFSGAVKGLCKNITAKSNYTLNVENPAFRFSILPVASFKANNIILKQKNSIDKIQIKDFKITIRLLPLLTGKLHVNHTEAAYLNITSLIKENVELDKDFFSRLETSRIKLDSATVNDFEILIFQKDIQKPISYSGTDFVYKKKNRYLKFETHNKLEIQNKISYTDINMFLPKNNDIKKTIFEINVSNLDLAPLRIYFKNYLPKDLVSLNGTVNIEANKGELITRLDNCSAIMEKASKSIILPTTMNIKSNFHIKRDIIDFKNVEISSKNLNASINGTVRNYLGKTKSTLDLTIFINKAKVEDVINLLPAFKIEELNSERLKNYKFYGDAIGNLTVRGRLPEPDVNGDIFVDNGILMKPIPNTTKGATMKFRLNGRDVDFDVSVPAGGTEKVWVKGNVELYNIKYADMTIKSTPSVDLHIAETVVNPLHEILNFIIGPVPIMDITGKGNIDITVKGNRRNPHIWGIFRTNDASVRFIEIPDLKLTGADSVLTFDDENAVFISKNGKVDGKNFDITGTCTLSGKFDFDIKSNGQNMAYLYKAVQTSTMIPVIKQIIPNFDSVSGTADLIMKVYGEIKDISELKLNKNAFAKGEISLKDNRFTLEGMTVEKTNGKINFDGTDINAQLKAFMGNSAMNIDAKIKDNFADLILDIPNFNPNIIIKNKDMQNKQILPFISVKAKYKGKTNTIEYNKIDLYSKILNPNPKSKLKPQSGEITLANGKLDIKNFKGYITSPDNTFAANLIITNTFSETPNSNGEIQLKAKDLSQFNDIFTGGLLPKKIQNYTKDIKFQKGSINCNLKIINGKLLTSTDLGGISLIYLPLELPINILNGSVGIKNNVLKLNKINILADKMPILADGEIKDIFDKQIFNIYLSSKPQQEFIDKYINRKQIYPIKIKGDIVYWARFKGVTNNFEVKSNLNMSKDSSFYHLGATVGDIENAIILDLDTRVLNGKTLKIKDFSYDKLIDSQGGRQTRLNMLKVRGGVDIYKDDLGFNDLYIKTQHPTDARIFNIIFRKPNIKQGQFTSDLKFNGKLSNPHILGDFHIFETNIPFLDTTMKNIELVFKDKTVDISSKGDILGNDIQLKGIAKNKLIPPYQFENLELYTSDLNLNYVVEKLKASQVDSMPALETLDSVNINSLVFDNLQLKADKIQLRNINATDFEANASLNSRGDLEVDKFKFNIAKGALNGKYKFNFNNSNMMLDLNADNINANELSIALFDLENQLYGDMTGSVNMSCSGTNFRHCMETLNGHMEFNVKDGRMPKLGSLEYLLKAGNLVKGGITGLSINSVIDLITPLKTGDFSSIKGRMDINDGKTDNLEILTKGEDLSIFIGGHLNFATSVADMEVLGFLSKKISTMFGPIGNMSINTLFGVIPGVNLSEDNKLIEKINKIPGIELSEKEYRKFIAIIQGNINGDDYVTSFRWIN